MFLVATTSLPAVYRPNDNRWNAARSCQLFQRESKDQHTSDILRLAPATYSRWLALPIYGQTCSFETTPLIWKLYSTKLGQIAN